MTLLLDTHVVLWGLAEPERIGPAARQAIVRADAVLVSVIAFIEVGVKTAIGKLTPPKGFEAATFKGRLLPITPEHGLAVGELALHHRDPFDRLLIAQAAVEGLTIVSADPVFAKYDVPVVDARI